MSRWLTIGGLSAGIGVALGAFGAHGLKSRVPADLLAVFETGVRYQMYHSLALVAVGVLAARSKGVWLERAGWAFFAGIVVFSGSLYLLVLTGARGLGAVTPLGGLAFLAGWAAFAFAAYRHPGDRNRGGGFLLSTLLCASLASSLPAEAQGAPIWLWPAGGHAGIPYARLTPDGTTLVSGATSDTTLKIWRAGDGILERTLVHNVGQVTETLVDRGNVTSYDDTVLFDGVDYFYEVH